MTKQSAVDSTPRAPTYDQLPKPLSRAVLRGNDRTTIHVRLQVVTPIFGGGYKTRALDDVDTIRAPSVRGHLRFWWRALYASKHETAEQLYERERELWGGAGADTGQRSAVEIRVDVESTGKIDGSDIKLGQTPGAYALWPARAESRTNTPTAPRRKSGTQFSVTLKVARRDKDDVEGEVKNALRAWILFGGYGGRTRRGLGTLTAVGDNTVHWLPKAATRAALSALFGGDIFAPRSPSKLGDVARLDGAELRVGKPVRDAESSWTTALDWLKDFRQGTHGASGSRAREPGMDPQSQRPSISNWPEADKLRHIEKKTLSHRPRHNEAVVWPRAGFGLPIIGQFQTQNRNGTQRDYQEPGPFKLVWRVGTSGAVHDRLASPLIVKALPLADGSFVPCALWLNRAYPEHGEVILHDPPRSSAPFDRLIAEGDKPLFKPLVGKSSLRQAFLDWLDATHHTARVSG
jgi:CRISPR-associated protein Cmr1